MAVGRVLAQALVRVRPETSGFGRELKSQINREAGGVGAEFGKRFSKDAQSRLRDGRGRFLGEGTRLGESLSDGLNKGLQGKGFGKGFSGSKGRSSGLVQGTASAASTTIRVFEVPSVMSRMPTAVVGSNPAPLPTNPW